MACLFLLWCISTTAQNDEYGIGPEVNAVLKSTSDYMSRSRYDSAQFEITRAFAQTQTSISETDLYYLHCYEAEIMYYNALFEQGLNSSIRTLEIATEIKNDTLIGNSENLIGLFMLNLYRYEEALVHLKRGASLISPSHKNLNLAFRYHAYANTGECFLKMNEPDSALFYSMLSIPEAESRSRERGVAIAQWNIAEAWLLKKDAERAKEFCLAGLSLVDSTSHRDVVQSLCASLMKVYELKNDKDSLLIWMNNGLAENANELNTDFSRVTFLQLATDMCVRLSDVERGAQLLKELNLLQRNIGNKQQSQRIAILKDYYEKNQNLIVAKELASAQSKELSLRKTISIILGILALMLVALIFIFRQIFRQRQRIAQFQYKEQLGNAQRDLELQSLQTRMEAVFNERNRIASDLHDDIGAALSSIRIYSGAAQKQFETNPGESLALIHRINESSTGMMERMSDIVWSINPKNDSGQSLVLRMKSFAGEVLSSLDIQSAYAIDEEVEALKPTVIARRNIYLIYKEAVNNIGKYSMASKVEVKMFIAKGVLEMHIEDNGKGFNTKQAQLGNGLGNMYNRAKAIGGTFHISSHVGRGTHLIFSIDVARISDSNMHS